MPTTAKSTLTIDRPLRPRVATVLGAGLLVVVAFQAALTLGAPLGFAAQGGANPGQLPVALRFVTGVGALVWLSAVLVVLARGGRGVVALPRPVVRVGAWVVVSLLGVGALLNLASSSPWERFGWGPFTLAMLVLSVVLARSGSPASPASSTAATSRSLASR